MYRLLPILAAVPLLLTFGVAEGTWTERWHQSHAAEDAAALLAGVPATVGEWHSQDEELDPRQAVKAELSGSLLRQYTNRSNGAAIMVMLVCGRPGPVALHTPDICFVGSGQEMIETQKAQTIPDDRPAQFFVAKFRRGDETVAEYFRVAWGWSANGDWSAPASPRLAFARVPALYKLYVVRPMVRADEPLADDPTSKFLRLFLPQLRQHLFPGATGNDTSQPKP
jgi:hypothetical protein